MPRKMIPLAHREIYHSRSVLYDKRLTLDNFRNQTTYECDYVYYLPKKRWVCKWPQDTSEQPAKQCAQYVPKSFESLEKWRPGHRPAFNLGWSPKPIVATNPHENLVLKHIDVKFEESAKKPHLSKTLMSPAVHLVDIKDSTDRDIIIQNMYKTDWARAAEWAVNAAFTKSTIPTPESALEPMVQLTYKVDIFPALPNGWREKSIPWDNKQNRATVDPTEAHWLGEPLRETEIMASERLVSDEVKRDIATLIAEDKLRQPHDKVCSTFAGYRPNNCRGVSLRRTDLPIEHPDLCVSELLRCRYKDNGL